MSFVLCRRSEFNNIIDAASDPVRLVDLTRNRGVLIFNSAVLMALPEDQPEMGTVSNTSISSFVAHVNGKVVPTLPLVPALVCPQA